MGKNYLMGQARSREGRQWVVKKVLVVCKGALGAVCWLLMLGLLGWIRIASMIWSWLGSLLWYIILVWLTSMGRVRTVLWTAARCSLGPPQARCMVSRQDKVVVVTPIYELGDGAQSPSWHLNSYMTLVCLSGTLGRLGLLRSMMLLVVWRG